MKKQSCKNKTKLIYWDSICEIAFQSRLAALTIPRDAMTWLKLELKGTSYETHSALGFISLQFFPQEYLLNFPTFFIFFPNKHIVFLVFWRWEVKKGFEDLGLLLYYIQD